MARKRNPVPSYLKHKNGNARAVWTDAAGVRQYRTLPGEYASKESLEAFAVVQLEAAAAPVAAADPEGITLTEVFVAYLDHADRHYRGPDGEPTGEIALVKTVVKHTRELYGGTLAGEFGPLALRAVREKFLALGWCRKNVNQQVERLRRVFKWAASVELIPFETFQRLTTVTGLQKGRTAARESEPVAPVDNATVDAVLPYVNRHVRGLIEFQRLTGCRPGEACAVRRCDIDTGGEVWLFRPPHHKTAHRGKSRTIAIGPKAQAMLREFFTPSLEDYLFSPRRAVEELRAKRAANRTTPRYPSHEKRNAAKRKVKPLRTPDECYTPRSYFYAISRAVVKANANRKKSLPPIPSFSPNRIRHTFATRVRKEHGLEAAQVMLGHSKADVTQIYAERDVGLALEVAAKIG